MSQFHRKASPYSRSVRTRSSLSVARKTPLRASLAVSRMTSSIPSQNPASYSWNPSVQTAVSELEKWSPFRSSVDRSKSVAGHRSSLPRRSYDQSSNKYMSGLSRRFYSSSKRSGGPAELSVPLFYGHSKVPAGVLRLLPQDGSDTDKKAWSRLCSNTPVRFVICESRSKDHGESLGYFQVKDGPDFLWTIDERGSAIFIVPLLNGMYLLLERVKKLVEKNAEIDSGRKTYESVHQLSLRQRRICVVFDLDNTLVHSIETEYPERYLRSADVHHLTFKEPDETVVSHVVCKVRPGAREVLHALSERFDLCLCTMGTKSYVTEALKILDPRASLFQRTICRENLPTHPSNANILIKDLTGIEGILDAEWTVVVDDSVDVWVQRGNVLPITKYYYFDEFMCESYPAAVPSLYSARVVLEGIFRQVTYSDKPYDVDIKKLLRKYHRR